MLFRSPIAGVRDLVRGGNVAYRLANVLTKRTTPDDFVMEKVLKDACFAAGVSVPANPAKDLEHHRWWAKLCKACQDKPSMTNYGATLLRSRLLRALSNRLAIDEIYRLNASEIESCGEIDKPIIVMGLPRCTGHMAAHVLARSGMVLAPTQSDTFSPALLLEADRDAVFKKEFRYFHRLHPPFISVRRPQGDQVDDDLTLHLQTPQSLAWGLLHGLDEYLMECIHEDQTTTYEQVHRVLRVFQWYKRCGQFSPAVPMEVEPIDNRLDTQTFGTKHEITEDRWLLHSPFALITCDAVHNVFPSMHVLWVHRALAQCIPSLCSSLCLHNALYTGKPPTESQLALMGEKVMGIFGSGTRHAVEYFADFDKRRMVHWSNRDVKRHATRLGTKTLDYWNMEMDRYRRLQMINGQTEYTEGIFRPLHDAQMPYFCLHEGIIGEVFQEYIFQFEEFAYEKRLGVTVTGYQPLAAPADEMSLGTGLHGKSGSGGAPPGSLGRGQPMTGHFLQEGKGFR
eukprot:gene8988-6310_t